MKVKVHWIIDGVAELEMESLEAAEAHEGARPPAHDRPGLHPRVPVVEHVPQDLVAGGDEAQGPRGRDAEVEHGLAAEELAYRGAQDGLSVCEPRVRGESRSLELNLQNLATGIAHDVLGIATTIVALLAIFSTNSVSILENDSTGVFNAVDTISDQLGASALAAGDWDGDGELDLAVSNFSTNNVSILENDP